MKKLLLMFAAVVLAAQTTSAQTVEDSKFFDNWYLGVNTGLNAKTTHTAIFKNLNPSAGLRIGRYFTPVFGFAIEGEAYFNNKASMLLALSKDDGLAQRLPAVYFNTLLHERLEHVVDGLLVKHP